MTENYVETQKKKKNFRWVSNRWTGFWPKITVLTQNGLKLIFYPGRHDWTWIDPVDLVLIENDDFDPKRPENSFFTLFDMVWPVLTRWDRFWPKMTVLTRNGLKTHFLPWSTWFDSYWPGGLGFYWKWRLTREKYFFEF